MEFRRFPEKYVSLKRRTQMKTSKKLVRIVAAAALLMNSACSDTSSNYANVSLRLSDSQMTSNNSVLSLFLPQAKAAEYGDIVICLERLRFELPEGVEDELQDDVEADDDIEAISENSSDDDMEDLDEDSSEVEIEDSIDFEFDDVVLDPQGTDLGEIQVPVGTYSRIEFDLDSDCLSGKSIQITNLNGSFSTDEEVTIRFEGEFIVSEGVQIVLPLANIIAALDAFNPISSIQDDIDEELEDLMESLSISVEDDDDSNL